METLSISRDVNFLEIEKAFSSVIQTEDFKLRLPNTLKERGVFGIEGLISQLIATWLKNGHKNHVFHTYCQASDQKSFDDLTSSFYGIVALRQSSQILSGDLTPVTADFALQSAYERVRHILAGSYSEAFKGFYVAIPSIKSTGLNREYNCPFYHGKEVVSKNEFKKIVGSAVAATVPTKAKREHIDKYIDHVSEMIRELFENTHKHGRTDHVENILPTNFRAVIFNSVDVTNGRLIELASSGVDGLFSFILECQMWMDRHKRNLPVLDITVVDAGPGYARKWTGKNKDDLTIEDEIEAVYECFQKNNSSSNNDADGSGLTHILLDLAKVRGWFRLRTGSVSVSKSFFFGGKQSSLLKGDIKHAGEFVEGTSFNMVIPLVDIADGDI